jgi:hypothetical protein
LAAFAFVARKSFAHNAENLPNPVQLGRLRKTSVYLCCVAESS